MSDISKKLNSIEKLAKEAEILAKNLQGNPFSVFDRIANDIKEQKDNAMAIEFTKCIGELLRKNGVVPKITEYTAEFDRGNTFERRYGATIDELDFSEHDKVFEDKIAKLEDKLLKLIKTAEQHQDARMVYERECEELKQRIAEFESEKSEKQGKSGRFVVVKEINGQEYVKVEDFMYVVNDLQGQNRFEDDWK